MGVGSTGMYVDEKDNVYAATVVGKTFIVKDGKKEETGNLDLVCTFRDGTTKLIVDVDPATLKDPA